MPTYSWCNALVKSCLRFAAEQASGTASYTIGSYPTGPTFGAVPRVMSANRRTRHAEAQGLGPAVECQPCGYPNRPKEDESLGGNQP